MPERRRGSTSHPSVTGNADAQRSRFTSVCSFPCDPRQLVAGGRYSRARSLCTSAKRTHSSVSMAPDDASVIVVAVWFAGNPWTLAINFRRCRRGCLCEHLLPRPPHHNAHLHHTAANNNNTCNKRSESLHSCRYHTRCLRQNRVATPPRRRAAAPYPRCR